MNPYCQFQQTDKEGEYQCERCPTRIRPKVYRVDEIKMLCPAATLTMTGRLLAKMQPGDGVKWLVDRTGIAALFDPGKCSKCTRRQEWLNAKWNQFICEHFSEPTKATAHPT